MGVDRTARLTPTEYEGRGTACGLKCAPSLPPHLSPGQDTPQRGGTDRHGDQHHVSTVLSSSVMVVRSCPSLPVRCFRCVRHGANSREDDPHAQHDDGGDAMSPPPHRVELASTCL
jgi:hypothetical protein